MNPSVDQLRSQLKSLGYLSHGIERWFELDPWNSRTFWSELLLIAMKASAIVAPFAALPLTAVMLLRNRPLPAYDALLLLLIYLLSSFLVVAGIVLATAGGLKIRPIVGIERPATLLWVSLIESAILVVLIAGWWISFPAVPGAVEVVAVTALLLLLLAVGTMAFSAALLSFSIHETRQIPSIHRRSHAIPLSAAGAVMLAMMLLAMPGADPANAGGEGGQIVVRPTGARVAFLAVDGLTHEVFAARRPSALLSQSTRFATIDAVSAPEVWASLGTGVPPELHGVRAIDAVRLAGSHRLLQSVSTADFMLKDVATKIGVAQIQPLPPAARQRHYVWELLGRRGVPSLAVNWWTSSDHREPGLRTVSQESVYAAAARSVSPSPIELALGIDRVALGLFSDAAAREELRFVTVYLPALDIILNRLDLARSVQLASSVRLLEEIDSAVTRLHAARWTVVLTGTDFVATTAPLRNNGARADVAPTLLDLFGFPASEEMQGRSLLPGSRQGRVRTFGSLRLNQETRVDEEYYEKLKSLGYVR